ncbi:ubiquitin carboxyl-terminal hydrolase 48-like isoform X2 [Halichondria panicea]|uniref:ubiquitin carboxyl-terminal hydrolase 48-like isoform X2 n=1 Tax=Halichondria panicea TaxID=6063 RepID=UPI00312B509B
MAKGWRSLQERKAWDWALTTSLDHISAGNINQAYRITSKQCKSGSCRTNCKWNPNCLNCLGEASFLNTSSEMHKSNMEDYVRKNEDFCGLKNLGSTCYVNSLLQVWFSDVKLREAVFSFKVVSRHPAEVAEKTVDRTLEGLTSRKKAKLDLDVKDTSEELSTTCASVESGTGSDNQAMVSSAMIAVIEQLQMLFINLLKSKRRVIDATGFVDSLHLQHDRQQDAQEFRKLFLCQLSCVFQTEPNPVFRRCVDNLYGGSYSYMTRCEGCGIVSGVESPFYELELGVQNCPTLHKSLAQFFKEESLSGDNQYHCSHCSGKRDASRYIQLKSLPPVLTLQMLRFVFNLSLLAKVKVTSHLVFPDQLDLSTYTGKPTPLYHLSSFIVHCGASAYTGHYIAYIKNPKTGKWWKFDDDVVKECKNDKLILCSDEDSVDSSQKGMRRCPKGSHVSNNVYMLVYKREDHFKDTLCEVPPHLQKLSNDNNASFLATVEELKAAESAQHVVEESRAAEMRGLYSGLSVQGEGCVWVLTSWIKAWLGGSLTPGERGTLEPLLCRHSNLSLNAVTEVKRISSIGLDAVCEKLDKSVCPLRMASELLCGKCVRQRCEEIQLKDKMEKQHKVITKLLKSKCTSASGFWVGKKSLQNWRKTRLQQLTALLSGSDQDSESLCDGTASQGKHSDKPEVAVFNTDLLCEHDELCLGEGKRRLVQPEVWAILHEHFPTTRAYAALHKLCQQCTVNKSEADKRTDLLKSTCRLQKEALSELYFLRNRPQISNLQSEVFVLPTTFMDNWTSCIRFPNTYEMPTSLCVELLLCSHSKLAIPVRENNWETLAQHVVLVHPEEWHALLQWFTSENSVTISVMTNLEDNSTTIKTVPEVCDGCSSRWQPVENGLESATFVYVYHLKDSDNEEEALSMLTFFKKRSRRSIPPSAKRMKIDLSQSLFQLQLMVMKEYELTPREQSLYLYGEVLQHPDKPLRDLGVESGSVLFLKAPTEEDKIALFLKETAQTAAATPEYGFRGTGLLDS